MGYDSVEDKRYELQEYLYGTDGTTLPVNASDADVNSLFETLKTMTLLVDIAGMNDDDTLQKFLIATHAEIEMLFYSFLHAVSVSSDEIGNLRHQLSEKKAMLNERDIDTLAS